MKQTTRKYFTHSLTLILRNNSLIEASLFHVLSFQYCLSIFNWSVRDACKTIFLGYDNITASLIMKSNVRYLF